MIPSSPEFHYDSKESCVIIALVLREKIDIDQNIPIIISDLLAEFQDIALIELPNCLPLIRDVQRRINFTPGTSLPNLAH
ncbi:hypothetical protein PanWU01x14_163410 [Parasponia andersonii]|uniref:Uncharacterized protein n=1 Tax=Parasponia andersonii TaxID=3476 RepID=A0A2P5CCN7_PARAD|nr:hypothetical protein PanWU01x14_163410 [Parasponia andersonii]